jgi:hypothetical protein
MMSKKRFWIFAALVLGISLILAACGSSNSSMILPAPNTISGTVSGYAGSDMVLQNNGKDDLLITAGSTTFTFSKKVSFGSGYSVTVKTQPTSTTPHQLCEVTNGKGSVTGSNITNILVTCTTHTWEALADLSNTPAFSDYTPQGQSTLYTANGDTQQVFSFPTTSDPLGVFSNITSTTDLSDNYLGLGWVGNNLFVAEGSNMLVYSISGDTWSSHETNTDYSHGDAESTADDSGFVYSVASTTLSTTALLKFNTANSTFEYIAAPADLTTSEPRAAWDSSTKRVYLGDYYNPDGIYAFNPADNSFTALASLPDAAGLSDAFCSDRRGHIFTANSDCAGSGTTAVWMYTEATDTWSEFVSLPFDHGCNASCTVSADGWLYFGDGDGLNFARIKIF